MLQSTFVHSEVSRNPNILREVLKFAAAEKQNGRTNQDDSDDEIEGEDNNGACVFCFCVLAWITNLMHGLISKYPCSNNLLCGVVALSHVSLFAF